MHLAHLTANIAIIIQIVKYAYLVIIYHHKNVNSVVPVVCNAQELLPTARNVISVRMFLMVIALYARLPCRFVCLVP